MDNITHALVGAAIAECALPRAAAAETRKVFMVAAVAAASAPDVDLVYTWITEAPLGYLLHHRGHSHTWPGLAILGAVILAALRCWPAGWRVVRAETTRLAIAVELALASHLLLDAGNVYGTHLFYPVTSRWYYGDAVFIFEPWLWMLLGVAVALNARRAWTGRLTWALTVALPLALLAVGLVPGRVVAALAAVGVAAVVLLSGRSPRVRAAAALAGTIATFIGMAGVSHSAKAATRAALPSAGERVVDIAANPNPAVPWCWSVVTVEHTVDAQELIVRRGTLSLLPRLTPAAGCVSHRMVTMGAEASDVEPVSASAGVSPLWNREWRVGLEQWRALSADCRVAAWLQFARVPFIDDDSLVDLRFDNPFGGNFSAMRLTNETPDRCPSNLTNWTWPRADVIGR